MVKNVTERTAKDQLGCLWAPAGSPLKVPENTATKCRLGDLAHNEAFARLT